MPYVFSSVRTKMYLPNMFLFLGMSITGVMETDTRNQHQFQHKRYGTKPHHSWKFIFCSSQIHVFCVFILQYISLLMDWVESMINNEDIFPIDKGMANCSDFVKSNHCSIWNNTQCMLENIHTPPPHRRFFWFVPPTPLGIITI